MIIGSLFLYLVYKTENNLLEVAQLINSLYLCCMSRKIIAYENYYKNFFDTLDKGTQEKVLYGLLLLKTQDRLPAKYVKFLKDGLYELRIEWQSNIYRIFFCYDEGSIVILFNGFQKKTQKTPDREIDKALKLKKEYYERKRTKDV
jgi:phage-related protein